MQFTGLITTGHGPQQPIDVNFADKSHPITKDLGDWTTVNEELYNNASGKLEHGQGAGQRHAGLHRAPREGRQGGQDRTGRQVTDKAVVAWTNTYNGKTRVFGTTLGHNNATVDDPRYLTWSPAACSGPSASSTPSTLKAAE